MSDIRTPAERQKRTEFWEPPDRWSVPIIRFGRFQVTLSYLVFAVAAVVIGIALNRALLGVGQEAVVAAVIAIGFWVSGWIVQGIAYTLITRVIGLPIDRLSVGLIGIKAVPRKWSPSAALAGSLGTITALIALGYLYSLIEGGLPIPIAKAEAISLWTAPSVGVTSHDSLWLAGAWICWVQAILQLYPLTKSLGRQLLGSLIALSRPGADLKFWIGCLHTCLMLIALVTIGCAIGMSISFPNWPIVLWLGVAVLLTSKTNEVTEIFLGFQRYAAEVQQIGMRERGRQMMRTRQGRRRSRLALHQEHGEAADAGRLDEILARLHQNGVDSLSNEDRRLLQRVSERVRRERDAESSAG